MKRKKNAPLAPRLKIWLERGGLPAFGDGKMQWLEAIESTGSLKAAAEALGMSYRGLWGRLRVMERRIGMDLVVRRTGGTGGGGAVLTDEARRLMAQYRRFRKGIERHVEARFRAAFGD